MAHKELKFSEDARRSLQRGVDILADARIRQELATLSQWPTIPQLFVRGELVGGCDIVSEMFDSGELAELLTGARASADAQVDGGHANPDGQPAVTGETTIEPAPLQIENRLN